MRGSSTTPEAILYGDLLQARGESIENRTPEWFPEQVDLDQLGLNGYIEAIRGWSGARSWMVKAKALPEEWTTAKQPAKEVSAYKRELIKYLKELEAGSLLFSETMSIELRPTAVKDLTRGKPERPLSVTGKGKGEEILLRAHNLAAVERLCGHGGEWRILEVSSPAVQPGMRFTELLYLGRPGYQIMGSVTVFD